MLPRGCCSDKNLVSVVPHLLASTVVSNLRISATRLIIQKQHLISKLEIGCRSLVLIQLNYSIHTLQIMNRYSFYRSTQTLNDTPALKGI